MENPVNIVKTHTLQFGGLLALVPCYAWASDPTGVATALFGIPGLILANGLAAFLRTLSPTRARQIAVKVIYFPLLFLAALVALDAVASALSRGWQGLLLCVVYFALLGLLLYLLRHMLKASEPVDSSVTPE
jgi:hypothetical protein